MELDQDYSQEVTQEANGKITLVGASVKQLINRVAGSTTIGNNFAKSFVSKYLDVHFTRDFVLVYRHFAASDELLKLLIERYIHCLKNNNRFECEPPPDANEATKVFFDQWRGPIRFRQ